MSMTNDREPITAKTKLRMFLAGLLAAILIGSLITASQMAEDRGLFGSAPATSAPMTNDFKLAAGGETPAHMGKRMAKKFNSGVMGNSAGLRFTPRVKRMIDLQYAEAYRTATPAQRVAMRDDGHWWDGAWSKARCSFQAATTVPGSQLGCIVADKKMNQLLDRTTRVKVTCGGASILGFFAAGKKGGKPGYWGAGFAGGSCLWSEFSKTVFN